ncbi:T9SS-dependent choice-of-anchor J family protein [Winogradskyella luteola]|uniref:Omp28-related outer membrane protein n=1 Tax=Winogradskyella luteola TaxID=2828330 RepID=A0A9X1F9H5_9FLAO|nr:choice-of-anchor J domain-containing protein [Winogradskyella luteola]MBV7269787.1 Omp28-related outer membrane protein [Winogradskyella luteola]
MIKKTTLLLTLCFACTQFATAQTYFYDDFSSGNLNDWTLTDSDGDGNNWYNADLDDGVQEEHATSASWIPTQPAGEILFPDNWMVSPAIDLTSASGNVFLEWKAYGQDQDWANENYSVYVATASDIATLGASATTFSEVVGASAGYVDRSLDVSAHTGQVIYVAFRHHNVSDQFRLNIDDVRVTSDPTPTDSFLKSIDLNKYSLISVDNQLAVNVKNIGANPISSLEINWNDGTTDHISTVNTSIAVNEVATVNHPMMVNYATAVEKNINVTITKINGITNPSPAVNSRITTFNTLSQSGTKAVLIEESTGTWCGWCPRGTVGLEYMATTYSNTVVAIAVHNGDPMTVSEYDTALVNVIGAGWPNSGVDRKLVGVDPGQASLQGAFDTQITEVVPMDLTASASQIGNNLTISAQANFYTSFSSADFRLGVIITEDGVTGTTSDYGQTNYYSGGGEGPMGGYESLPNPVPASQMVYDHVGRALLGGFNGQAGSVPAVINAGDTASYDFNYAIPATSNQDNMHIVVVLIDQTDGTIVSAVQSSVTQALSVEEVSGIDSVKIYPNPAKDLINVAFDASNGDYKITVTDMLGRTVINKSYEGLFGNQNIELPVAQLNAGHYIMNINDGNASYSTKFIVNK